MPCHGKKTGMKKRPVKKTTDRRGGDRKVKASKKGRGTRY